MATEQKARFTPVGSGFDLPELEHGVLDLWDREKSFDALRRKNAAQQKAGENRWVIHGLFCTSGRAFSVTQRTKL